MEENIITIATHTYSRAQLLKGILENEGIECFLSYVNVIQSNISDGVRIRIRESDAEKALEIIDTFKLDSGEAKEKSFQVLRSVRRILVPVDFSPSSQKATELAVSLASKYKAEVKLFHVYHNPGISGDPFSNTFTYQIKLDKYFRMIQENAQKELDNFYRDVKNRLSREGKLDFKLTHSLGGGVVYDEILTMAKTWKPGVIIMGTSPRNGKGDFLGSDTLRIIERSNIPVIVVPEESVITKFQDVKNILYATNFDDSDYSALRKMFTFIRPFDVTLHCVHIQSDRDSSLDEMRMKRISGHLKKEYPEFSMQCDIIESEDIIRGLNQYIAGHSINMISLTTHKRGLISKLFNPSLTKKVVLQSNIPVLIFHATV